jgi:uncharacterized protein (AIM24 family)
MIFGQEGIVMKFTGPGVVYTQTRNKNNLVNFIRSNTISGGGGSIRIG